jgi:hypothetical protein
MVAIAIRINLKCCLPGGLLEQMVILVRNRQGEIRRKLVPPNVAVKQLRIDLHFLMFEGNTTLSPCTMAASFVPISCGADPLALL